jgi:hypothetical protein
MYGAAAASATGASTTGASTTGLGKYQPSRRSRSSKRGLRSRRRCSVYTSWCECDLLCAHALTPSSCSCDGTIRAATSVIGTYFDSWCSSQRFSWYLRVRASMWTG